MIRILIVIGFLLLLIPQTSLGESKKGRAAAQLQSASLAREKVETAERKLDESLETLLVRLDSAIIAIQPENFVGERLAIAELRKIVPEMRHEAEAIIGTHQDFQIAAKQYKKELEAALPTVYQVAKVFRQFAVSESYDDLQTQYVLVAESFEAIADKYQRKKEQVGPSIAAVSSNLAYVTRTALFLERLETFLVVMPNDSPETERFLKSLAKYVKSFATLRKQLKKFHRATVDGSSREKKNEPSQNEATILSQGDRATRAVNRFAPKKSVVLRAKSEIVDDDLSGIEGALPRRDSTKTFGGNLSGFWTVGDGADVLRFVQQGASITVSLVRSPTIQHVKGRLRIQNHNLHVEQLHYHLQDGQTLNLGGFVWEIFNEKLIRCSCPSYAKNAAGTYVVIGTPHHYTLRRLLVE